MSEQVKPTPKSGGQKDDEPTQPLEPVIVQQPSNEQPQQEEPSAEIPDDAPGQEREDRELAAEEPELQEDLEEEERPNTGRERGDGLAVKGKRLLRFDYAKLPGSGEGPPLV